MMNNQGGWRRLRWIVQLVVTISLISLILIWIKPNRIANVITQANAHLLFLALFFTPLVIGIKSLRWWALARTSHNVTGRNAVTSYLAGLTLATITPMAVGEAGRGFFIPESDKTELTAKMMLDKLIDLSVVILFSGIGLALMGDSRFALLGTGVLAALCLGWLGLLFVAAKISSQFSRFHWIKGIVQAVKGVSRQQLFINIGLAFIGFAIFYGQVFIVLRAIWPATPAAAIAFFPIITFSTILPIALSGVGIREWTAIFLLAQFEIPAEAAFTAFFGHFIIVQLLPALIGVPIIVNYWQALMQKGETAT